ncbi:MAG: family 78 glycoside hydrolase catalytic domain [Clostridia bacterium]|nr:family 78 glycoside hydrolase catalytic domain [Clostridia bacterium]
MKHQAKWITAPVDMGEAVATFRYEFRSARKIKKATICATAMGVYAFFLNGARIGKGVLTPGWTVYGKRVQYQTYDVTALLSGNDCLELGVGQGWAVGHIGGGDKNHYFADHTSLLAWLTVTYADGTVEEIGTDESWDVYTSQVLFTDIYNGETVDKTATVKYLGKAVLSDVSTRVVPQVGEWITEQERLAPVAVIHTPNGETVLDFGQNMTGYVEIRIKGNRGDRIVLHHGEVLDKDGNFYNANYRAAKNEVTYVCSGEADVFKPTYTFQGFRYVRLVEFSAGELDSNCFRAVVVHSDMKRTGDFRCGNEKINQLYHNIVWGQKSNYLDVPTDCPQRDERLGWTGDAQVFCRTAAINYDVERFFRKWLGDVALDQGKSGAVKDIVPVCIHSFAKRETGSAAWGDVACVAPWEIYMAYGDKALLKKNYPMMKKWVGYMRSAGPEEYLWLGGKHYGDWLAMDGNPDGYVGLTPKDYIACAYYAYSTGLLVKAGKALGEDMREYEELYQKVRSAFRARYIVDGKLRLLPCLGEEEKGLLVSETQTAYVLALYFGLTEGEETAFFAKRLAEMVEENGNRMTTGFVGTPYILHALSQNGYTDLAYRLLMQEENPSWIFSVNHGATTMWEHWNSQKEDGSFWSTDMNSFNHYAYGAVFDWMFGVAMGITPIAPAYGEISLEPHPNKCLGFAETVYQSRNGVIRSHWYYKGDTVYYEFDIPEGVTAKLRLPGGYTEILTAGSYRFAE